MLAASEIHLRASFSRARHIAARAISSLRLCLTRQGMVSFLGPCAISSTATLRLSLGLGCHLKGVHCGDPQCQRCLHGKRRHRLKAGATSQQLLDMECVKCEQEQNRLRLGDGRHLQPGLEKAHYIHPFHAPKTLMFFFRAVRFAKARGQQLARPEMCCSTGMTRRDRRRVSVPPGEDG